MLLVSPSPSSLTLWVLQPVAVHIVEATALKLLLAVVGHRNWNEWIHAVKPPLMMKTQTEHKTSNLTFNHV